MWVSFFVFIIVVCAACTTNVDCRSNVSNATCDAQCIGSVCVAGSLTCNPTQVCYEFYGLCLPMCYDNSDCAKVPTVLHFPNPGVCHTPSGKCYDCLTTNDCQPERNISCGAQCSFNDATKEYLCGNGMVCIGSSCQPNFHCANAAIKVVFTLFLLVLMASI